MDARTIINENLIGAVATINADGSPWVTPLHIFADDENVYWFSTLERQHSGNIKNDGRASLALYDADTTGGLKGVYISGHAEMSDDYDYVHELAVKKLGLFPKAFEGAAAYKLPIGALDEEKSTGNCWYFYS